MYVNIFPRHKFMYHAFSYVKKIPEMRVIPSTYENAISSQSWVTKSDSPCIYQMNAFIWGRVKKVVLDRDPISICSVLAERDWRFSV